MQDEATKRGIGRLRNQTVIDMFGPSDVIVVDLFGKTDGGTFVGDKLANYIGKTTGMVVDGGMFWLGKLIPTVMPGDVVLGDEEGLYFIPPHLVKDAIQAAENTMARDESIKLKKDLRKYKSSELYGRPSDPALLKEMEEYIKTHQKK